MRQGSEDRNSPVGREDGRFDRINQWPSSCHGMGNLRCGIVDNARDFVHEAWRCPHDRLTQCEGVDGDSASAVMSMPIGST